MRIPSLAIPKLWPVVKISCRVTDRNGKNNNYYNANNNNNNNNNNNINHHHLEDRLNFYVFNFLLLKPPNEYTDGAYLLYVRSVLTVFRMLN